MQAVLDAGILPPLLKLLESQDSACREDATWVLYNISSNHDMRQIRYLAEQNGVRALCNLLSCSKELDVLWKGCGTVAAVALKGLRNVLVAGQQDARNDPNGYNTMAALVAEAHGVERIEALTSHASTDVRQRARLLLERFFGAEVASPSGEVGGLPDDYTNAANAAAAAAASAAAAAVVSPVASLSHVAGSHFPDPDVAAAAAAAIADPAAFAAAAAAAAASTHTCSCPHPHPTVYTEHSSLMSSFPSGSHHGPQETAHAAAAAAAHFHASPVVAAAAAATGYHPHGYCTGGADHLPLPASGVANPPASPRALPPPSGVNGLSSIPSSSGSSTESDPEDDDSDSDLLPPPPAPCTCVLCSDTTPLADRRPRKTLPEVSAGSSAASAGSNVGQDLASASKRKGHSVGSIPPSSGSTEPGGRDDECESRASAGEGDGKGGNSACLDGDVHALRTLCDFCSGGGRFGDGKAGLAAKLGRAVRLGHSHCVAILLSRMTWGQRAAATEAPALLHPGGGPPDSGVSSSLPAVVLAAHLGKPDCLALLLRRCRPDLDATHGKKRLTPLAWAAHKGYFKCCALLLEHQASASSKCGDCLTALHLAASGGGHLAICNLLLDHGAPVNALSSKYQTPLCLATQKGYSRLVRLLLEHGADCNNEDEAKFTPLHIAASNGFAESADELISAGATIDCKTRNNITPLHYAVQGGHASVVKLLVAAGAKVNCTRKPLLIIAADDGNREVVQILLDALAAIDCTANIKATVGKDGVGKDVEIHDKLTPLHLASSKGHKEVVELLLRRGASVDARTEKGGWSALDFAVMNGHSASAILLLDYSATVTDNARKIGSSSLVQVAARQGNKDVVRSLLKRLQEQKARIMGALANSAAIAAAAGTRSGQNSASASIAPNTLAATASPAPPSPLSLSAPNGEVGAVLTTTPNGDIYGTTEIDVASLAAGHHILPPLGTCTHAGGCQHGCHDGSLASSSRSQGLQNHVNTHHVSQTPAPLSGNRYDPRSSEGDESGFGTGPGYGNGPTPNMNGYGPYPDEGDEGDVANSPAGAATTRLTGGATSRRRAAKDDHSAAVKQREREIKRREMEGKDARERLKEALALCSIPKISEAIHNASKLFLQSQSSAAGDGTMGGALGSTGTPLAGEGLDDPYTVVSPAGQGGIDLPSGAGVASNAAGPVGNTAQTQPLPSHAVALQIEADLGVEVGNARKILARLQLEERRAKDQKAKEAADLKRDNNQQLLRKAMTAVLEGGDVRSLTRSVNRAKRAILEDDDPVVAEVNALTAVVQEVERAGSALTKALKGDSVDNLNYAIQDVKATSAVLLGMNGESAATRALGGRAAVNAVESAENVLAERVEQRDSAEAEKAAAKALEESAMAALNRAVESGALCDIERSLEGASSGLMSKDSEAAATIEAAKKGFAKSLKSERRKLRQARASNDVAKIDLAVEAAQSLTVTALDSDIADSVELAAKLREQETKRSELDAAVRAGDAHRITEIRARLQALGMFAEAETARAELDSLQRASRARTLLSTARADAQIVLDRFRDSETEALENWTWPDGQRLCDLVKRTAGKFGGSLDDLCAEIGDLARELAVAGRDAVGIAVRAADTRALAGAIAGYEKSFMNVDNTALFAPDAGTATLSSARSRLAHMQATEQENVKAEAAQVKTEYAIATSRRSAARARGPRRGRQSTAPASTSSQLSGGAPSDSVASANSSECGEDHTLDAEIAMSGQVPDFVGRTPLSVVRATDQLGALGSGIGPGVGTPESECSHYYLWKEGTTVQCARCSNVRESVNGEWLQRVKKRGARAPPDISSVPLVTAGPQSSAGAAYGTSSSISGSVGASVAPARFGSNATASRPAVVLGTSTVAGTGAGGSGAPRPLLTKAGLSHEDAPHIGPVIGEKMPPVRHATSGRTSMGSLLGGAPGVTAPPPPPPPPASALRQGMTHQIGSYVNDGRPLPLHRQSRQGSEAGSRGHRAQSHNGILPSNAQPGPQYVGLSNFAPAHHHPAQQTSSSAHMANIRRGGVSGSSLDGGGEGRTRIMGVNSGSSSARHDAHVGAGLLPDVSPSAVTDGAMDPRIRHVASGASLRELGASTVNGERPNSSGSAPPVQSGLPQGLDEAVVDLSMDFANENFGFDIDSLLIEK